MNKILPLLLILASCGQPKDQWILQSFDKDKGYVFVRNGIKYETTCFATGSPVLTNEKPDPDPEALPPRIASSQSECGDILRYIHKPVPNFRQVNGTILLFTEDNNQKLEFVIKHAG